MMSCSSEQIDRARRSESLRGAEPFGVGFHALFLDAFELDLYAGLALSRKSDLGSGAMLSIRQAY